MNKKAQIFTVIAIMVLMLMFVSFEVFSIINQRDAIETRVSSMDSMLHSIEVNLERQLYIAGFRGIFVALEEIRTSGQYISDIHAFINETFFNGDVTNLTLHLNGQYYTQHDDAPSFLQKIEGNLSAYPEGNGIESFVRFP